MANIPLAQDPNEIREKNRGVGRAGRALLSLTEFAVPNISQINAKNFCGFLTTDFSTTNEVSHMQRTVSDSSQRTHFLSYTQFMAT